MLQERRKFVISEYTKAVGTRCQLPSGKYVFNRINASTDITLVLYVLLLFLDVGVMLFGFDVP